MCRRDYRPSVLTPLDLERTYGLTEGNIFHGDLTLEQLFFNRPVAGWSQYRTPIAALFVARGRTPAEALRERGTQLGAPGVTRLKERQIQGGGGMSGNGLLKTADFIILGAGVMGASIAFHLARRNAGRILVIDREHAGSGGSGRSSALVRMHYRLSAGSRTGPHQPEDFPPNGATLWARRARFPQD